MSNDTKPLTALAFLMTISDPLRAAFERDLKYMKKRQDI